MISSKRWRVAYIIIAVGSVGIHFPIFVRRGMRIIGIGLVIGGEGSTDMKIRPRRRRCSRRRLRRCATITHSGV